MSRIKDNILRVGKIGENPDGSITRLGYSKEYFEAIEMTKKLMETAGLTVRVDRVGNIIGRKEGTNPKCKTIMIGSHLDTVPKGGMFDGNMGVMAAIECMNRIKDENRIMNHSFEIVGFNSEESSPLGGTFGSRAMVGLVDLEQEGFEDILKSYNLTKEDVKSAEIDSSLYKEYLEMHIEQGDRLYNTKIDIGVVTGVVGITRYTIRAIGESNHAGTTMMNNRKDALVAMAKLITIIDKKAKEYGDGFVATVGTISIEPGSANVIPGVAEICLELRHMDSSMYEKFITEIKEESKLITEVKFEFKKTIEKGSVKCDETLIDTIEKTCNENKVKCVKMPSGAGHDSNPIAHKIPIGMLFVPSKNGISHSGLEWTEWEDVERGTEILYKTILKLDEK